MGTMADSKELFLLRFFSLSHSGLNFLDVFTSLADHSFIFMPIKSPKYLLNREDVIFLPC